MKSPGSFSGHSGSFSGHSGSFSGHSGSFSGHSGSPTNLCHTLLMAALSSLLFLVLVSPSFAYFNQRYEYELDLDIGAQYGTIDQWRLGVDDDGDVRNVKENKDGFFQTYRLRWDNRLMFDLRPNMILDLKSLWNIHYFDPQNINSERFDTLYGEHEMELGYSQSQNTLWAAKLFYENQEEELHPLLDGAALGAELALDRTLGEQTYLTLRAGTLEREFGREHELWNHGEYFFRALYTNAAPEKYSIETLPHHPKRYSPDEEKFFRTSKLLELWKHRGSIEEQMIYDEVQETIPPAAPPPTEDMQVDVEIMESVFAGGFGLRTRDYTNLDNQGFLEADAQTYVRWSLGKNLALTFDDRFAWQDYEREDQQRLLFDHWENDFRLSLSHSKNRQQIRLDASLRSVIFDLADQWSYHSSKIAGSWDYQDGKRYSYTFRSSYQRDMPHSERASNQYSKDFRVFAAFRIHFDPRRYLRFSWQREREIVTGIQSEFDSSYNQDNYELRYRRTLSPRIAWEAGYSFERERHEIFHGNNRDENLGFVNLSLHL